MFLIVEILNLNHQKHKKVIIILAKNYFIKYLSNIVIRALFLS